MKKLTRSDNKVLFGICGGLAEYIGADAAVIRLITLILGMFFPFLFFAYLISALFIPKK